MPHSRQISLLVDDKFMHIQEDKKGSMASLLFNLSILTNMIFPRHSGEEEGEAMEAAAGHGYVPPVNAPVIGSEKAQLEKRIANDDLHIFIAYKLRRTFYDALSLLQRRCSLV